MGYRGAKKSIGKRENRGQKGAEKKVKKSSKKVLTKGDESAIIHKLSRTSGPEASGSGSGYLENRIVKMNSTNESECLKKRKNMIKCSSNFETTSGQF